MGLQELSTTGWRLLCCCGRILGESMDRHVGAQPGLVANPRRFAARGIQGVRGPRVPGSDHAGVGSPNQIPSAIQRTHAWSDSRATAERDLELGREVSVLVGGNTIRIVQHACRQRESFVVCRQVIAFSDQHGYSDFVDGRHGHCFKDREAFSCASMPGRLYGNDLCAVSQHRNAILPTSDADLGDLRKRCCRHRISEVAALTGKCSELLHSWIDPRV